MESPPQEQMPISTEAFITKERSDWNKLSTHLKSTLLVGVSFAAGGYAQWSAEIDKALGIIPSEPGKFPNGMADFHPSEEIIEGGLSSAAGAFSALFLYRLICAKKNFKWNPKTEVQMMVVGSILGYSAMAFVGGPVLHSVLDISDVKWGSFK